MREHRDFFFALGSREKSVKSALTWMARDRRVTSEH